MRMVAYVGVGGDDWGTALGAVCHVRGDDELSLLAKRHLRYALEARVCIREAEIERRGSEQSACKHTRRETYACVWYQESIWFGE
jgi:uncharacterized small protein (DUF1192 family)